MTLADTVLAIQADIAKLQTAVAALSAPTVTVDLSPVLTAVASVQTTVNEIDAQVKPTPAA